MTLQKPYQHSHGNDYDLKINKLKRRWLTEYLCAKFAHEGSNSQKQFEYIVLGAYGTIVCTTW